MNKALLIFAQIKPFLSAHLGLRIRYSTTYEDRNRNPATVPDFTTSLMIALKNVIDSAVSLFVRKSIATGLCLFFIFINAGSVNASDFISIRSDVEKSDLPDLPILPVVILSEKYPLARNLQLSFGPSFYYGDKFSDTYSNRADLSYFFKNNFALQLGGMYSRPSITNEHKLLTSEGFRASVTEPTHMLFLNAKFEVAYGKFIVGKHIVRTKLFGDIGPALIKNEILAHTTRSYEHKTETNLGLRIGLQLFFPMSQTLAASFFSDLFIYKKPFSKTYIIGHRGIRKDYSIGLLASFRLGL